MPITYVYVYVYFGKRVLSVYLQDPVDGVLASGNVDRAVTTASKIVRVGNVVGLRVDERGNGVLIGRRRMSEERRRWGLIGDQRV